MTRRHRTTQVLVISTVSPEQLALVLNWGYLDQVVPLNVSLHTSRRRAILQAVHILREVGSGTAQEVADLKQTLKAGDSIGFERLNIWFSVHFTSVIR